MRPVPELLDDVVEDVEDVVDEDADFTIPAPPRRRVTNPTTPWRAQAAVVGGRATGRKPGHRQGDPRPATERPHGTSPWVGKPRDGFTTSMAAELKAREETVTKPGALKAAASVKGIPRDFA